MYQTILSEIRNSVEPSIMLGNDVWKIIYELLNVKHPNAVIINDEIKELNQRCQNVGSKYSTELILHENSCSYLIDNNHIKWHWYEELNRNNDKFVAIKYGHYLIRQLEELFILKGMARNDIHRRNCINEIIEMGFNPDGFL